jgi:hypothetical protein
MAKSANKPAGSSRIRFVMVDAEIAEGDVGSITQAIQNALRGPAPIQRLAPPPPSKSPVVDANGGHISESDPEVEVDVDVVDAAPETPRQRAPRKPAPTPNIIDIEMNNGMSLAAFAQGKDSKSHHKRFLIAAAWLKEHRNIDAVSDDHVYTCYRSLDWPTNIPDFGQPLRELKARKFFTQPARGLYTINHIGLDYVKKLGGSTD